MKTTLPNFNQVSILVIGDVMLDRYWFGDTSRISPEAPVPVVQIHEKDDRPGGAGNVALNLASLGTSATLIGIAGEDEAAFRLQDLLTDAHLKHEIIQLPNFSTISKLRVISRHQQLIRLDFEEKTNTFDPDPLIIQFKNALLKSQAVILSDYNKGTLAIAPELIKLAKEKNVPVLVDPKGLDYSRYKGADIITPNLKEFEAIMGACHTEREIAIKGQQFLQTYQIGALLLTRGDRGMTLIRQHQEDFHLPANAREVFDVTGAGDTVIAVLAAAIAAGADILQAMNLANKAAGLVVAKLGAATVTAEELAADLNKTSHSSGILSEEALFSAVNEARSCGKKIVFTNGCFDILHAGHITYLQQAKQLGDFLIVAINDDQSVKRLKGETRPVNSVDQRLTVLAGIGAVDWVVSFADDTPERLLKKLKPDVLVKGGDYTVDEVVGAPIVHAYGGMVRVLGVVKDLSTTAIIERMKKTETINDE